MTDYSKTKIYKIESHLGDKIYVGSTARDYLSQRLQGHKNAYKRWKDKKDDRLMTSFILFDEYGLDNCKIVLIESYPCNNKDEKNAREGHFIKELNCVNKFIAGRLPKEYKEDNKEKFQKYFKDLYQEKREERLAKQKIYDKNKKERKQKEHKEEKKENEL